MTIARLQLKEAGLPPGSSVNRLVALMRRAIAATELDLSGLNVLTEAATGAYGVTSVIAAMAGAAHVQAITRDSRYGSVAEVADWTMRLANAAGVADRIDVDVAIPPNVPGRLDVVTNSGHLRPLTAALIDQLPQSAVIALMFEAWEFRPEDIDLAACVKRGIPVVGVNERHEAVDVFSFLGPLCAKLLHDCGLAVRHNKIALVCDNDFSEPIAKGLAGLGGRVEAFDEIASAPKDEWDAVVIALSPTREPRVGAREAGHLAEIMPPEAVVTQFWGDIDRAELAARGLHVWPPQEPAPGHMAILLSAIGPEPIVRLQTGGLRAAEFIRRGGAASPDGFAQLVKPA